MRDGLLEACHEIERTMHCMQRRLGALPVAIEPDGHEPLAIGMPTAANGKRPAASAPMPRSLTDVRIATGEALDTAVGGTGADVPPARAPAPAPVRIFRNGRAERARRLGDRAS